MTIQNLFKDPASVNEFDKLSENNKVKLLDNYKGYLLARQNYQNLLVRYSVAIKRDDKDVMQKIAHRVGFTTPKPEEQNPQLLELTRGIPNNMPNKEKNE